MSGKRHAEELDPDYEDVTATQTKRQRLLEEDAKETTKRKIEGIIRREFITEIHQKEMELSVADQRLSEARIMLDRLRACIVANYYGSAGQTRSSQRKPTMETMCIHPTVKKHIMGKAPVGGGEGTKSPDELKTSESLSDLNRHSLGVPIKQEVIDQPVERAMTPTVAVNSVEGEAGGRGARFKLKKKIVVGNLSKYIPVDKREDTDPSTHKWMVYVRGPKSEPRIEQFVKKVWFFLHPSYRPNDLVEISSPPFHLTRRGWGEFPVRIQLHFTDPRNKKVDLIHHLKLDRTYTGLQTLGAETHVDIEIERDSHATNGQTTLGNKSSEQNQSTQGSALLSFKDCLKKNREQLLSEENKEKTDLSAFGNGDKLGSESLPNGDVSPEGKIRIGISSATGNSQEVNLHRNVVDNKQSNGVSAKQVENLSCVGDTEGHMNYTVNESPQSSSSVASSISLSPRGPQKANLSSLTFTMSAAVSPTAPVSKTLTLTPKSPKASSPQGVPASGAEMRVVESAETGAPVVSPLGPSPPGQANTGMVYVRCVDNQGKIYLIPQHLIPQLTGLQAAAQPGQQSPGEPGRVVTSTSPASVSPVKPVLQITSGLGAASKQLVNSGLAVAEKKSVIKSPTKTILQLSSLPVSPSKASPQKSTSPAPAHRHSLSHPRNNLTAALNAASLIRPQKSNCQKTTATLSVTKAVGESGMLTLNTVTSPSNPSPSIPASGGKDIKVSAIAGCPQAKQPLIFITQNSQKSVSLLQSGLGKATAVIGGLGGVSLAQQGLPQRTDRAGSKVGKKPVAGRLQKLGKPSSGVTSLIIGGTSRLNQTISAVSPQNQSSTGLSLAAISPKLQSAATQLVITGSNLSQQTNTSKTGVNYQSLLNANTALPLSQPATSNSSQILKTGATILLNKGLPVSHNATVSPALRPASSAVAAAKVPENAKPSPQTVVATIGNQHYLLQLIPDLESSKPPAMESASPRPASGQFVIGQTSATSSAFSMLPPQSVITTASMNSVLMNPGHMTMSRSGNFRPVQLTSRYSRKRDKGDGDVSLLSQSRPGETKARIILGRKSRTEQRQENASGLGQINPDDIPDLSSLVKAVIRHYPIVSHSADRSDHPYCASSVEDWLKWNVGKRRASEWQRASCVRQHILKLIGKNSEFKGEELWSIKRIVNWCRLHAFSPHYLEKTRCEETTQTQTDPRPCSSFSVPSRVNDRLDELCASSSLSLDEDEIDIISVDVPPRRIKQEVEESGEDPANYQLPVSDTARFIQEISKRVGVRFGAVEVEPGLSANITEELVYTVMKDLMEDVVRQSFAAASTENKYPLEIGVTNVFEALCTLQATDFLTNQYCGTDPKSATGTKDR